MAVLILALLLVALVLTVIALVQSRGQSLLAWAVLAICVALLLPHLGGT